MEQQHDDLFSDIKIDEAARTNILGMAKWAMIIVATSVGGYLLSLIKAFTAAPAAASNEEGFGGLAVMGGESVGSAIITIIIGLFMNYFLYRFSTQAKKSITEFQPNLLASSIRSLKIYFIITTVIMILVFLVVLIAFVAIL